MAVDTYHHLLHSAGPGKPLLFLFHGTGGDENQFWDLGRDLMPGAGLVSPRGDVSEFGSARFFRRRAEGVYDMVDLIRARDAMTGFIRSHVEQEKPSQVLGLGYSNGANILASVLFAEPSLFDAVVLMHPLIPFDPEMKGDLSSLRILVTAGRKDPICPPNLTARLEAYLKAAHAAVSVVWHEGGHEVRNIEIDAARAFLRQQPLENA